MPGSGINIVLNIADEVATIPGDHLGRQALEAVALESYRAGRYTKAELRRMLGWATRYEVDGFLKGRGSLKLSGPEADRRCRMTADQMLSLGAGIAAMPRLDRRPAHEIAEVEAIDHAERWIGSRRQEREHRLDRIGEYLNSMTGEGDGDGPAE